MDMFPDTAMVRQIQQELDQVIQQGVRNITRLIRANDPAVGNTLQARGGRGGQRRAVELMEKSLSDRLVRDGLLTADLLRQLQQEWSKEQGSTNQRGSTDPPATSKARRKNKK